MIDRKHILEPAWGVVLQVHGPLVGPASQISYTVEWYTQGDTFVLQCAPHRRWDDGLDTRAIPVNSPVEGYRVDGQRFIMTTVEMPDHGDCQP